MTPPLKMLEVQLAPHQKKALSQLQDGNILWGAVGSGKSRVALAYYTLTEEHQDIYVITTAKKRDSLDWHKEAHAFGIAREPSDAEVASGIYHRDASFYGKLVVDSWNNIDKYRDVEDQFFIFDEQRLVGKGKWVKAFLKIAKKNRWILLSATPGDTWLDYIPVFIANGFYRNRTELIAEHVIYRPFSKIPRVERYVNVQKLVRLRNQILVHMPYYRETIRHPITVWTEFDVEAMSTVSRARWNLFDNKPIRDMADMLHQMRRVVNSDPSRIEAISDLLNQHPRLIVFYNFDYELEALRELQVHIIEEEREIKYAEWNGHRHEEIPDAPAWLYVVQYAAGAEGWNCTTTDAVAFYSLTYSYKLWEQAHGRIDRMDTPFKDLYYYTLRSKAPIDWAIWRSLKSKQNFQAAYYDMTDDEYVNWLEQQQRRN